MPAGCPAAASSARRVFPEPPGPVRVTRRERVQVGTDGVEFGVPADEGCQAGAEVAGSETGGGGGVGCGGGVAGGGVEGRLWGAARVRAVQGAEFGCRVRAEGVGRVRRGARRRRGRPRRGPCRAGRGSGGRAGVRRTGAPWSVRGSSGTTSGARPRRRSASTRVRRASVRRASGRAAAVRSGRSARAGPRQRVRASRRVVAAVAGSLGGQGGLGVVDQAFEDEEVDGVGGGGEAVAAGFGGDGVVCPGRGGGGRRGPGGRRGRPAGGVSGQTSSMRVSGGDGVVRAEGEGGEEGA